MGTAYAWTISGSGKFLFFWFFKLTDYSNLKVIEGDQAQMAAAMSMAFSSQNPMVM